MLWKKIVDETWNYKVHFCSAENFDLACAYMRSKGAVPVVDEKDLEREALHFEPGGYGMRSLNWPSFTFEFLGRKLVIDADKVDELITELYLSGANTAVEFGGKKFYFVVSRFSVLMLDREERTALLPLLEERRQEAEAIAEKFNEELDKALKDIPEIVRVQKKAPHSSGEFVKNSSKETAN